MCGAALDTALRRFYSAPLKSRLERCHEDGCTGADRISCFSSPAHGDYAVGIASWFGGGSGGFTDNDVRLFHMPPGAQVARQIDLATAMNDQGDPSLGGLPWTGHLGSWDLDIMIDHLGRVVASSAKARVVTVYDPARKQFAARGLEPDPTDPLELIDVSIDGDLVISRSRGGRLFVYSLKANRKVLNGLEIDDETVLFTDDGYYEATPEGAHFVQWYFPGLREHHSFSQFAALYDRPDIVRAALDGKSVDAPGVSPQSPPGIDMEVVRQRPGEGALEVRLAVLGADDLRAVRLYVDGAPHATLSVEGRTAQRAIRLELPNGLHAVSAVAADRRGVTSAPRSAWVRVTHGTAGTARLLAFGVGVDVYDRLAAVSQLKFAGRDVRALADALRLPGVGQFAERRIRKPLVNHEATPQAILAGLADLVAEAKRDDLIILHFAGHGLRGSDGGFYFLTSGGDPRDLGSTALAWEKVAAVLSRSQARVLVLLDACHSGLASLDAIAPNDAYAEQLVRSGRAGMVVFAASKGRQFSLERPDLGHGLFTHAILQVLGKDRQRHDENQDGIIDLAEFYRAVKLQVLRHSGNRQSPWVSRNEIVGAMPVF
jgi:hypothetical protein